jgi:ABC-2 type transport system ATP-binding protein
MIIVACHAWVLHVVRLGSADMIAYRPDEPSKRETTMRQKRDRDPGTDQGLRPQAAPQPPKTALKGIDLDVPRGSIFGLLGPNGAGKSTLINILAGPRGQDGGRVRIWGFDQDVNPRQSRAAIGVMPQELNIDPFFTPARGARGAGGALRRAQGAAAHRRDPRPDRAEDKAEAYARTLSGGMRRRLLLGKALVHRPQMLVLDEPTAGVDIELRQMLWQNVRQAQRRGHDDHPDHALPRRGSRRCATRSRSSTTARSWCATRPPRSWGGWTPRRWSMQSRKSRWKQTSVLPRRRRIHSTRPRRRALAFAYRRSREPHRARYSTRYATAGVRMRDVATEEADLEDVFLELTRAPADAV